MSTAEHAHEGAPYPLHECSATRRKTRLCWRCRKEVHALLFCPRCQAVQSFPDDADFFEIMGLPRSLSIDVGTLQRRYYELHRLLHPDRFQTASPEERQASLRNTALVNQAYRTLKDPEDRGLYWLTLHGEALGKNNRIVPPEIAELVFETQELLQEFRDDPSKRPQLEAVYQEIQNRTNRLRDELESLYRDASSSRVTPERLEKLKRLLSSLSYLSTLLRDMDRTLEN